MIASDLIGVSAGHDVDLAPLRRHPHHRQRDRRVHVTENEIGLIAVDQLVGFCDAHRDVVAGILDQQPHLAANEAASLIDLLKRESGARHFSIGKLCIYAGERLNHPQSHGLLAQCKHR